MTRKTAGVMGGMGPAATVDFMAKVIELSDSGGDQDHVHLIVDQDPTVPDRQAAINGGEDNVSARLADMALRLQGAGADFLVMVCNTAHVFLDELHRVRTVPFINIIDESVADVIRLVPNAQAVGVMATTGCVNTGVYQRAVESAGMKAIVPAGGDQAELMRLIQEVKAGNVGNDVGRGMQAVAEKLVAGGADAVIGGCTEIPIVFEGDGFSVPVVSSTNVLAERTVALATGQQDLPAS